MNNEISVPAPKHGDKQTTDKGNILVCIHYPGKPRKFFYMTPQGEYTPHPFTVKNEQFLTKTEWNFLYGKTKKVEEMGTRELEMAEELFAYITQDVTSKWSIADIKKGITALADQPANSSCSNIRGLAQVAKLFT